MVQFAYDDIHFDEFLMPKPLYEASEEDLKGNTKTTTADLKEKGWGLDILRNSDKNTTEEIMDNIKQEM